MFNFLVTGADITSSSGRHLHGAEDDRRFDFAILGQDVKSGNQAGEVQHVETS